MVIWTNHTHNLFFLDKKLSHHFDALSSRIASLSENIHSSKFASKYVSMGLFILLVTLSQTFAQEDSFSKQEADYFRAQKIYPLVAKEQDGDYPRSAYLVPHDITIPSGKVLTIYPGSTLLFKKDTRLIVQGKLISKGQEVNPVMFCKLDNSDYFTPLDSIVDTKWDGIFVEGSGTIELQYSHISESKYGISIEEPNEITLDSVQFYNNRYQNLKIGTKVIPVNEFKNIFYQSVAQPDIAPPIVSSPQSEEITKPKLTPTPEEEPKQKSSPGLRKFRLLMGTGMAIGAIAGAGGYYSFDKFYKKYNDTDDSNSATKFKKISKTSEGFRNGGIVVAGVCLIGFTVSIFF